MHSATLRLQRMSKTTSSYQLRCRNSNAYRRRGNNRRNERKRPTSFSNCGGSWNSTTETLGDSTFNRVCISAIEFSHLSVSRFQWVMNFEAFQLNRKSCGVPFRQERTASREGVR